MGHEAQQDTSDRLLPAFPGVHVRTIHPGFHGDLQVCQWLMCKGLGDLINTPGDDGYTPLINACVGDPEVSRNEATLRTSVIGLDLVRFPSTLILSSSAHE